MALVIRSEAKRLSWSLIPVKTGTLWSQYIYTFISGAGRIKNLIHYLTGAGKKIIGENPVLLNKVLICFHYFKYFLLNTIPDNFLTRTEKM